MRNVPAALLAHRPWSRMDKFSIIRYLHRPTGFNIIVIEFRVGHEKSGELCHNYVGATVGSTAWVGIKAIASCIVGDLDAVGIAFQAVDLGIALEHVRPADRKLC